MNKNNEQEGKKNGFFRTIKEIVLRPFRWLFSWARRICMDFVFMLLFPFKRRLEKKKSGLFARIYAWSKKDVPQKKEEALEFRRKSGFVYLAWAFLATLTLWLLVSFGSPSQSAGETGSFFNQAIAFLEARFSNAETLPSFSVSEAVKEASSNALSSAKDFWFYFQAFCGATVNGDIASSWLASSLNLFANCVCFLSIIVPLFLIGLILLNRFVSTEKEGESIGKSKPLVWWDDFFLPRVWNPLKRETLLFYEFLREQRWVKTITVCLVLWLTPLGWLIIDLLIGYFLMTFGGTLSWLPSFSASFVVGMIKIAQALGIPGAIAISLYLLVRINRETALKDLRAMQSSNEEFADSLAVINAINGHVGSGKTTMLSSIAVDQEANFRDYYLSVMMKYQAAFPRFSFQKLERWIREKSDSKCDKADRLATGARIKQALVSLWNDWWDSGFKGCNDNGKESFFGYEAKNGIRWFDGAKEVLLIDALQAYAESYFMYFSGQKLVTSNYPIAMDDFVSGTYFPIYAPTSAYLDSGCSIPSDRKAFSHIFDEDFFRIKTPMDPDGKTSDSSIGGGVIAMTEASNERGNRFDYVGMSKKDSGSNQLNDGWNQAMRLIRHWFMVDGRPCCCFIYDYQREDAMNADARLSAENTIFIQERSEENNTLPLWWLTDFVCSSIEAWWNRLYWYSWRPNHAKETLFIRLLGGFCGLFINHKQRMRFSYGYETVTLTRTQSQSDSVTGRKSVEEYYFPYRKVRGILFKSDVYAPILTQRSLTSDTGWMDQPSFNSIFASSKDFAMEHSFFIDGISSLFDPKEATKSVKNIERSSKENGTE